MQCLPAAGTRRHVLPPSPSRGTSTLHSPRLAIKCPMVTYTRQAPCDDRISNLRSSRMIRLRWDADNLKALQSYPYSSARTFFTSAILMLIGPRVSLPRSSAQPAQRSREGYLARLKAGFLFANIFRGVFHVGDQAIDEALTLQVIDQGEQRAVAVDYTGLDAFRRVDSW